MRLDNRFQAVGSNISILVLLQEGQDTKRRNSRESAPFPRTAGPGIVYFVIQRAFSSLLVCANEWGLL